MKNTLSKVEEKKLEQVAMDCSESLKDRGNLDIRHNDTEDFLEVYSWSISEMVRKTYLLGRTEVLEDSNKQMDYTINTRALVDLQDIQVNCIAYKSTKDCFDAKHIAIWSIKEILKRAYLLGRLDAEAEVARDYLLSKPEYDATN